MFSRIAILLTAPKTSLFFVGLMFFIPFTVAYHHPPIASFYGEWSAALLGVIAMLTLFSGSYLKEIKIPQFALVFLGLASILLIQAMLGMTHSPRYAILVLSYAVWAFFVVLLGAHLRSELGWQSITRTLAWFLVFGGIYNVVFVILQIAMKSGVAVPLIPSLNAYGTLSQANNFADYISLAIASLVYLYAQKNCAKRIFWPVLLLFITLLAFSGSRSTWLYLTILTLLSVLLQIKCIKTQTGSKEIRSLLRVSLILLPLFALIQWMLSATLPDALINLPNERIDAAIDSKTGSLRMQFWVACWYLIKQYPWLGIGAGQIRWQSFLLLDDQTINASKMAFEHAHNLFIHLLTEMGIFALLMVILGFVSWIKSFKWAALNLETWWLIALLTIMGMHSMLEYPLWYTYFLGIAAFLLGMGEEKLSKLNFSRFGQLFSRVSFASLMLLGVLNLATMCIAYEKLENWMLKAIKKETAQTQIDQDAFYNDFIWARQYSVLAPYAELMFLNSVTPQENQVKDLIALSESVMRFMPTQNMTYQHALLLKLNGDEAEAVKQLNRALIAYPKGLNNSIERQPMKYWQDYLDLLSIARPIPVKKVQTSNKK